MKFFTGVLIVLCPFFMTSANCNTAIVTLDYLTTDLQVQNTVSNATPNEGNNVTFTITASNISLNDDVLVEVEDILPSGYTYVSSNPSVGTYDHVTGIWQIGNLNASDSETLTIVATVNGLGDYSNVATISGDLEDTDLSNNEAIATTTPIFNCNVPGPNNLDTDGDGVSNPCDLDSDNDGILDADELGTDGIAFFEATPQAFWTFNNTLSDASGNGFNQGVPTVSPTFSTDAVEGSFSASFNGTTQLIRYSVDGRFMESPYREISFSAWIKPNNLTGDRIIYEEGGDFNGVALWLDDDILTYTTRSGGAGTQTNVSSSEALVINEWHHVAATFNNGTLTVYLNGVSTSTNAAYSIIPDHQNDGGIGGVITNNTAMGGGTYYSGLMDAARYDSRTAWLPSRIQYEAIRAIDTDGDSIPDYIDLDSDNDGIVDAVEANLTSNFPDVDADGRLGGSVLGNGIPTVAGGGFTPVNSDGDDVLDYLDLDSDNDGVYDATEAIANSLNVGLNGRITGSQDANGVPALASGGYTPLDTNLNSTSNFRDLDSDGDGCSDANEYYENSSADGGDDEVFGNGTPSVDGNGLVIAAGYDGNGLNDTVDDAINTACEDFDGDGIPNVLDIDSDNDGILDVDECSSSLVSTLQSSIQSIPISGSTNFDVGLEGGSSINISSNQLFYPGASASGANIFPLNSIEFASVNDIPTSTSLTANYTIIFPESVTELELLFYDFDGVAFETVENLSVAPTSVSANTVENSGVYTSNANNQDITLNWSFSSPVTSFSFTMTRPNSNRGLAFASRHERCLLDIDQDGILNKFDLDSDNDGVADIVEAGGIDTDNNGIVDGTFTDGDGDGWSNVFDSDNGGTALDDADTDTDGDPNRIDLDSDGDGCSDSNEYYQVANADGNADGSDDAEYGSSSLLTTDANGLVDQAAYNGSFYSDAINDSFSEGCSFVQTTPGNWNISSNWREQAVPTFNNDAIIRANSTVTANQSVKNLVVDPTFTVSIGAGLTVNIDEDLTNNGDFDGDGVVVFDGAVAQNIFGDGTDAGTFTNIELDNSSGLTLQDDIIITSSLNVESGTFTSNGRATFFCDFSGSNPKTAMIDDLTNGNIVGDVTTQQCFPGRRAFRFVTSTVTTTTSIRANWQEGASAWNDNPVPVYGTHITGLGVENGTPTNDGLNGFDWQPSGNPSLFEFDNSTNSWSPIDNTDVNTLEAGKPYRIMIRGSRSADIQFNATASSNTRLRATGTILKGPITYNSPSFGQNLNDVIFIGNPFQAIVDLQLTLNRSSNIRSFVQVWDPVLGGIENDGFLGGRGAFTTIDLSVNDISAQSSNPDSDANKYLQAKQGIYFLANGNGQPSIVFSELDKRIQEDQTIIFSNTTNVSKKITIKLFDEASFATGGTSRDAITMKFSNNYSNDFSIEDAPKTENVDENLARLIQGNLSSYEKRSIPTDGEELALFVNEYRMTDYVFSINVENIDENRDVYLKDNYTGELHALNTGENAVSFSVNSNIISSTSFNRFSLLFEDETLGVEDSSKAAFQVYPNPVEDELNISFDELVGESAEVKIYDLLGRQVYGQLHQVDGSGKLTISNISLESGAYVIKIKDSFGEMYTQKILKK